MNKASQPHAQRETGEEQGFDLIVVTIHQLGEIYIQQNNEAKLPRNNSTDTTRTIRHAPHRLNILPIKKRIHVICHQPHSLCHMTLTLTPHPRHWAGEGWFSCQATRSRARIPSVSESLSFGTGEREGVHHVLHEFPSKIKESTRIKC